MANKAHHADPRYKRLRAILIPQAYANPNHRCPTCGRTLAEIQASNPNARWDCDHVIPGTLAGGLRARCSPCNRSAGARDVNARRSSGYTW